MDLSGGVAIVTGAARGIGRATAVAFAKRGCGRRSILADVKAGELEETAALVAEAGDAGGTEAVPREVDVTDLASLREMYDVRSRRRYGRLEVVFNNAGIGEGPYVWPELPAGTLGRDHRREPARRRPRNAARARADAAQRWWRVVVNTSSGAALAPLPPQAVYAATKAGVVHFTESCAPLAESHGVRVNCVLPGHRRDADDPRVRVRTGSTSGCSRSSTR